MAWVQIADWPGTTDGAGAMVGDPTVGGKVYTIGGDTEGVKSAACYVYDPSTDSWDSIASMNHARSGKPGVVYHAGKVYVFGGDSTGVKVEVYDVASDSWTELTDMPRGYTGTGLGGGWAIRYGGIIYVGPVTTGGFGATIQHDRYNIASDTWTNVATDADSFEKVGVVLGDMGYTLTPGDHVAEVDVLTGTDRPSIGPVPSTVNSLAAIGTQLVGWGGGPILAYAYILTPVLGETYTADDWEQVPDSLGPVTARLGQPATGDTLYIVPGQNDTFKTCYKLGVSVVLGGAGSALDVIGQFRFHPRWPTMNERLPDA